MTQMERRANHIFVAEEPMLVPQGILDKVRANVYSQLARAGFVFSTEKTSMRGLDIGTYSPNRERFAQELGISEKIFGELQQEIMMGLNEIVTNYLTGQVKEGKLKDAFPEYSKSWRNAQSFIDFVVEKACPIIGTSAAQTRQLFIKLLADHALVPEGEKTTYQECLFLFLKVVFPDISYEGIEEFERQNNSEMSVSDLLELIVEHYVYQRVGSETDEQPKRERQNFPQIKQALSRWLFKEEDFSLTYGWDSTEIRTNFSDVKKFVKRVRYGAVLGGIFLGIKTTKILQELQINPGLVMENGFPISPILAVLLLQMIYDAGLRKKQNHLTDTLEKAYHHEVIHETTASRIDDGSGSRGKMGLLRFRQMNS
jgi:hypothetical protein